MKKKKKKKMKKEKETHQEKRTANAIGVTNAGTEKLYDCGIRKTKYMNGNIKLNNLLVGKVLHAPIDDRPVDFIWRQHEIRYSNRQLIGWINVQRKELKERTVAVS